MAQTYMAPVHVSDQQKVV